MVSKIWVILVGAFAVYSVCVYVFCDRHNNEGIPNDTVKAGWTLWQQKNCQSCHQLYGLGGYLGPDLTNDYSAVGKGPLYMAAFISHGTARMPDFNLNTTQTEQLISFLAWVDKSGSSKVTATAVHWSGTYKPEDDQ